MIVDTSAVLAILLGEPERRQFVELVLGDADPLLSAASYVECGAVVDARRDPVLSRRLDELLAELGVRVVELTVAEAEVARRAYRDFGRGSGHPAGLNYGDCFSYALAVARRRPLLFKGDDFGHTDVEPALRP